MEDDDDEFENACCAECGDDLFDAEEGDTACNPCRAILSAATALKHKPEKTFVYCRKCGLGSRYWIAKNEGRMCILCAHKT